MDQGELLRYGQILRGIKLLGEEIRAYATEIERLRAIAGGKRWPDGQPHSGAAMDMTGDAVAAIADLRTEMERLQREIGESLRELVRLRWRVERAVRRLPHDEAEVIRLKYFHGLTYPEIAERLAYSTRQVIRIHSRAMKKSGQAETP